MRFHFPQLRHQDYEALHLPEILFSATFSTFRLVRFPQLDGKSSCTIFPLISSISSLSISEISDASRPLRPAPFKFLCTRQPRENCTKIPLLMETILCKMLDGDICVAGFAIRRYVLLLKHHSIIQIATFPTGTALSNISTLDPSHDSI